MPLKNPVDLSKFFDEDTYTSVPESIPAGFHVVMITSVREMRDKRMKGLVWKSTFSDAKGERRLTKKFLVDRTKRDEDSMRRVDATLKHFGALIKLGNSEAVFNSLTGPDDLVGTVAVIEVDDYQPEDSDEVYQVFRRVVSLKELPNHPRVNDAESLIKDFNALVEKKGENGFDASKWGRASGSISEADLPEFVKLSSAALDVPGDSANGVDAGAL